MSSLARKAVKAAVLSTGVASIRRSGDIVILLYHRVGDGSCEIELTARAFERHLQVLSQDRVLTLDEALSPGSPGGIVVTFDDGFRDFTEVAAPLLAAYGVPATLYLTTGGVSGGAFAGDSEAPPLTWSGLRDAVATGYVTVGAHTHSHADLSRASFDVAHAEMSISKGLIEDRLGVECRHFAYPWAVASPAADRAARTLFTSAALPAWKTNRRENVDPFRLGRIPVLRSDGQFFFRTKRRALLDNEALVYKALRKGPWGR